MTEKITIELTNKKLEIFMVKFLAMGWIVSLLVGLVMFVQYVFVVDVLIALMKLVITIVIGMLITLGFYAITLGVVDEFLVNGAIDELVKDD